MPSLDELLGRLWSDYAAINPQARQIHGILRARGETVVNDHIALRTFSGPQIGLEVLARAFVGFGYRAAGEYEFPRKKLRARHYLHPDPERPKIFISELVLERTSRALRGEVEALLRGIEPDPAELGERWDMAASGRPWPAPSHALYRRLLAESEYAAWLLAFGLRANHFTVSVNALSTIDSLQGLNALVRAAGIPLSQAGGVIKGSRAEMLEQSSTVAAPVAVDFAEGVETIPGCYYEFARRYADADGRLFTGFVTGSADRIFESTDRREA